MDPLQDIEIIHKDFPLPLKKNLIEDPEKVRAVSSEDKKNQTKLVDILERQGSRRT